MSAIDSIKKATFFFKIFLLLAIDEREIETKSKYSKNS